MNRFPKLSEHPSVVIIFLSFNRLYYTRKTLPVLLESSDYPFSIRIVDNGSSDGTVEYLKNLTHPRIEQIIFNKKNEGLVKPTKRFWEETEAELVGKIDNDILVPKGWVQKLTEVHQRVPNLGVAGYCHFRQEDFDDGDVKQKTTNLNGIQFRKQPWIGGNYLMKRSTVLQYKKYRQSRKFFRNRILYGFNKYQELLAHEGFIHGYLCNEDKQLYLWEHIDDPRHALYHQDEDYLKIRNMTTHDIINWYKKDAKHLLEGFNI